MWSSRRSYSWVVRVEACAAIWRAFTAFEVGRDARAAEDGLQTSEVMPAARPPSFHRDRRVVFEHQVVEHADGGHVLFEGGGQKAVNRPSRQQRGPFNGPTSVKLCLPPGSAVHAMKIKPAGK
jgi:hypothetical protein